MSELLEVISINRITDAITGDLIYQVQFGKIIAAKGDKKIMVPAPGGPVQIKEQITVAVILNAKFEGPVPYRVGSKWNFSQDKNGNISLKEVKE